MTITGASASLGAGRHDDLDAAATTFAERRAATGGRERDRLRTEFTTYCLPFAGRLASRYRHRGEALEDLEQVARLGLLKAIDRYDPERGSFTSYASLTVVGELKRYFRDGTWGLHVVRRLQELGLEVREASSTLTAALARTPTTEEVAAHIGVPVKDVRDAVRCSIGRTVTSLNAPAGIDAKIELGDTIGATDGDLDSADDRLTVAGLVRLLPPRERRMVAMRFFGNCTQTEIASALGISQMQVSRVLGSVLSWLREGLLCDETPPWRPSHLHHAALN